MSVRRAVLAAGVSPARRRAEAPVGWRLGARVLVEFHLSACTEPHGGPIELLALGGRRFLAMGESAWLQATAPTD